MARGYRQSLCYKEIDARGWTLNLWIFSIPPWQEIWLTLFPLSQKQGIWNTPNGKAIHDMTILFQLFFIICSRAFIHAVLCIVPTAEDKATHKLDSSGGKKTWNVIATEIHNNTHTRWNSGNTNTVTHAFLKAFSVVNTQKTGNNDWACCSFTVTDTAWNSILSLPLVPYRRI